MTSFAARLVGPIAMTSAVTISACARVMKGLVEYVSHDDRVHHDPLSEHWNWSWLAEVEQ